MSAVPLARLAFQPPESRNGPWRLEICTYAGAGGVHRIALEGVTSDETLRSIASSWTGHLFQFKEAVRLGKPTAFWELYKVSAGLAARLFGNDRRAEECEHAIAQILYPLLQSRGLHDRVVELPSYVAADSGAWRVPLEFIRIAGPARKGADETSAAVLVSRLLGFQAIVTRPLVQAPATDPIDRPARVLALRYVGLYGKASVDEQVTLLQRHPRFFDEPVIWPQGVPPQHPSLQLPLSLSEWMVDQIIAISGRPPGESGPPGAALLHFACHFDTDDERRELRFNDGGSTVASDDLWNAFSAASGLAGARPDFWRTIVFLNACDTGSPTNGAFQLSRDFAARNFGHIIATESALPHNLATHFARQVYGWLMRGEPLGAAFLRARTGLVDLSDNPGGLLYTLYGDPGVAFVT